MVRLPTLWRHLGWYRKIPRALTSDLAKSIVQVGSLLGVIATATGIWYSYDAFVRARISDEKDARTAPGEWSRALGCKKLAILV